MRHLFSKTTLLPMAALAALLCLPTLAELSGYGYLISLSSKILIYALAAVSLDLILGYGGMVSLGHAAYLGVGAYVVGILAMHHQEATALLGLPVEIGGSNSLLVSLPAAVLIASLAACFFGALSLRTSGMHFIMITLAFAQMGYYFFVSLEAYGGDDGLSLWSRNQLFAVDLAEDTSFYYLCLTILAAFLFFCHRLVHSRFGRVIRGIRENEKRMKMLGFATYRYKLACFTIAGGGAGLAGALLTNHSEFVSPGLIHWTQSGELIVMVLLGGMGTLFGPVIGAATLLLLEEILSAYTEHWMAFLGPFLILVVLFARRGLYGLMRGKHHE
ncbi:MAG: branched-chain amino acid ABC transporter permease [Thermodesulfobacteriota bacterium]